MPTGYSHKTNLLNQTHQRISLTGFWIYVGLLIYQGFEYDRVTQGSEYAWIYAWIIPKYAWLCLNMPEYAGICANISKYVWLDFVLHVPFIIPCLLERVRFLISIIITRNGKTESPFLVTMFQRSLWSEGTWDYLLKETKFDFFYISWKYLLYFMFCIKYFYK